jgi:hypothetical protein
MVQVPYWTGSGTYPSVTVRMDFRGPDIGDFETLRIYPARGSPDHRQRRRRVVGRVDGGQRPLRISPALTGR